MYLVEITFVKPLADVEPVVPAHREFLDIQYAKGLFLVSGPKNPRDGGIIVTTGHIGREELDVVLAADPYALHGLATYKVTEFNPVKFAPALADLV